MVDLLSASHNFDYIYSYAKNLYCKRMLSLSERFRLAHKNHISASNKFFDTECIFTHCKSEYYKKKMKCFENNTLDDPECVKLIENWQDYPVYVTVGHNPAVEIWKVFDLILENIGSGKVKLTWHEPKGDGTKMKKEQITKNFIY